MTDILSGLNERQREAVTTTEGFVRVIAGAGSGKTRALAHRYAYLVRAGGIHPGNILCVTFTRKAAGEMKRRVRSLIGEGGDTSLITTYHGFCVRVLRESIGRLYYPENFTIIDVGAQKRILEEIYGELDLRLDHASFENLLDKIGKLKATPEYVGRLIGRSPVFTDDGAATLDDRIINRYLARQRKIFALDFDDLVNFVFVLFETHPDVREMWQKRLYYIQVDEFQDSSDREMRLIDTLCAVNRNLFVVGDPDQNIYEWRGAKVGILVGFDKTHPGTRTIVMDRNYRSTKKILACANTLIAKNNDRIKKSLYTEAENGADVIHIHSRTEEADAAAIVAEVRALSSAGFKLSDMAMLYRASFLSQFLESALMRENIPYELIGGARFFDRMEIVDATAYMTMIDRDDDSAFTRIANKPRRRLGRTAVARIKAAASAEGRSMLAVCRDYAASPDLRGTGAGELAAVVDSLRADAAAGISVSELLDRALVRSGYEKYIREAGNMERLENLTEYKKLALEMERERGKVSVGDELPPEFMPLGDFLQQVALMRAEGDESERGPDRVKLMTIHNAKGLEFPVVFVVGMTEGVFPSSRTIEERRQAGLEEERRLCFVALTRAMKRLYMTESSGSGKTPSRFLFEMGEENYVRRGELPKGLADAARSIAPPKTPVSDLREGDEVDHVLFGHGRIESVNDELHVYNIRFDKTGEVRPIADDYDFGLWARLLAEAGAEAEDENRAGAEAAASGDAGKAVEVAASGAITAADALYDEIGDVLTADKAVTDTHGAADVAASGDLTLHFAETDASDDNPASDEAIPGALDSDSIAFADGIDITRADAPVDKPSGVKERGRKSRQRNRSGDEPFQLSLTPAAADAAEDVIEPVDVDTAPDYTASYESMTPPAGDASNADADDASESGAKSLFEQIEEIKAQRRLELEAELDKAGVAIKDDKSSEDEPVRRSDKPDTSGTPNLWNDPSVPKSGWVCVGITDLGEPSGVCEMCGKQIIRYVHHMRHESYRPLGVGCVCAGRMEGDPAGARKRENDFKSREKRRESFASHPRKRSRNGNEYFKYKGEPVVVLEDKFKRGSYKAVVRNVFTPSLPGVREALLAAFDIIDTQQEIKSSAEK